MCSEELQMLPLSLPRIYYQSGVNHFPFMFFKDTLFMFVKSLSSPLGFGF